MEPPEPDTPLEDARQRFRAGPRIGIGLGAASFVLAVTFGATARTNGWSGAVIALLAPALLAALIVVDVFGPQWTDVRWPVLAGLAVVPPRPNRDRSASDRSPYAAS